MKLVTTILLGPDSDDTIERCIASIRDHVDEIIVIETTDHGRVLPNVTMRTWQWINDFAAARNEALACAAEAGADWAITTDADEWWDSPELIRGLCENAKPEVEALYFQSAAGQSSAAQMQGYWQARAIRLPCSKRWAGRTHEGIALSGLKCAGPLFYEDAKTPDQIRTKCERDAKILLEIIADKPKEPRWYYYLGECYIGLKRYLAAVHAFEACASLRGDREERALALYRAGETLTSALHQHEEAVETLGTALAVHAGMAEIPWMAGVACLRAGSAIEGPKRVEWYEQALYWARLAEVHGNPGADDNCAINHRLLPARPEALGDGPKKLVEQIYKAMGFKQCPHPREQLRGRSVDVLDCDACGKRNLSSTEIDRSEFTPS